MWSGFLGIWSLTEPGGHSLDGGRIAKNLADFDLDVKAGRFRFTDPDFTHPETVGIFDEDGRTKRERGGTAKFQGIRFRRQDLTGERATGR